MQLKIQSSRTFITVEDLNQISISTLVSKYSGGAIAGIGVACIVAVALIAALIV